MSKLDFLIARTIPTETLMRKNFSLLSNLGGCKDWCTRVDELLNSIVDETSDINGWKNEG